MQTPPQPIPESVLTQINCFTVPAGSTVDLNHWRKDQNDRGRFYLNMDGLRNHPQIKIWIEPEPAGERIRVRVRPQIGKFLCTAKHVLGPLIRHEWKDLQKALAEHFGRPCFDCKFKLDTAGRIEIPEGMREYLDPVPVIPASQHVNPTGLTRDQLERKPRNWLCKTVSEHNLAGGKSLWHARKSELLDLIVTGTPIPYATTASTPQTPAPSQTPAGANPMAPATAPRMGMSEADRTALVQKLADDIMVNVQSKIEETIEEQVSTRMKEISKPVHIEIKKRKVSNLVGQGEQHARFQDVMECIEAGIPVMLVGPAGSGKTTLAEQVAKAMDLDFTFNSMSAGVTESSLFGRLMPPKKGQAWEYSYSPFSRTYENGGVHLFDEIDAADPNLLVSINAAIANNFLSIPFTDMPPIKRHEDTVIISAANTFGKGANRQYAGRNKLDDATLDRFAAGMIEVDYDRELEFRIVTSIMSETKRARDLLDWAWAIRERIEQHNLRRLMSTRFIKDAASLLEHGKVDEQKLADRYFVSWSKDEEAKVNR